MKRKEKLHTANNKDNTDYSISHCEIKKKKEKKKPRASKYINMHSTKVLQWFH